MENTKITTQLFNSILSGKTIVSCNVTDGDHIQVLTLNTGKDFVQILVSSWPTLKIELSTSPIEQ